jgi:transposase-like protein
MRTPKAILIWEEVMPTLVGFGTFAALFEEQISEKISRRILPRAARQRCLAHRMRNLASKVPEEVWPEFKARVQAAYQAPSRAIARELAAGVVADYGREHDRAVACFRDDFEACIARVALRQKYPATLRLDHCA